MLNWVFFNNEKMPVKGKGMADRKENEMLIVNSVDYVRGMKGKDSVLLDPKNIPYPNTGGGVYSSAMTTAKWYRIAIGAGGNDISSVIVNIGKFFNNGSPASQLFYISADAFSNGQKISLLANGGAGNPISKMRILYKNNASERVFLDVYIGSLGTNLFYISYSNNINFTFQVPEEVSGTPDAGYSVKEFTF